jgi:hypothetical protein
MKVSRCCGCGRFQGLLTGDLDTKSGRVRPVGWTGVPVRSHGKDGFGPDRGADHVLEPARLSGHLAHRLGA